MKRSPRIGVLLASAAIAAAIALAGCQTDGTDLSARAMTPLSSKMIAEIEQKNMAKDSPILLRIFKQEAELEVWKQDRTGRYALLKTYPICRWSGELGPKVKEGDRQAPEGFYSISPAQINPKSKYYLAFNIGYPNAYDRAWGRTGAELMVHGDCSSRGCYAMTDEQISEIYALGREAFFGGQQAFQVQAYPFRMTAANFAKHRNNPNLAFWKMLKRGNDHFEVTRREPKIYVCEKRYIYDAQAPANSSVPLAFNPTAKCPAYEVSQDIVAAVHEKQRRDEYETAELVTRGTKTSPVRTGTDGGMHPVFLAALQKQDTEPSDGPIRMLGVVPTPGTIPQHVVPPGAKREAVAPTVNVASRPASLQVAAVTASPSSATPLRIVNGSALGSSQASGPARTAPPKETTGAIPTAAAAKTAQMPLPLRPTRAAQKTQEQKPAAAAANRIKPAATTEPSKAAEVERPATAANTATSTAPNTAPMPPAAAFENRWSAITNRGRYW